MERIQKASNRLQTIPTKSHFTTFSFNGCEIRVVKDEKGEPWWLAVDVCNVLRIKSVSWAIRTFQADEKGVAITERTIGGRHYVVNDVGLYRLIMQGHKPEKEDFLRWIVRELFPDVGRVYAVERVRAAA